MLGSDSIKIPINAVAPLLIGKLRAYADLYDTMDKHGGWIPYPDSVLDYFKKLGVTHWAQLYFPEGAAKWIKDQEPKIVESKKALTELLGTDPSPEIANKFLTELAADFIRAASTGEPLSGLEFMGGDVDSIDVDGLPDEERQQQHDNWLTFLVNFYNDLALASHGESMDSLVSRAIKSQDDDALVKAIQIDRSLLPHFSERLWKQSMKGNSDFFDSLAYRVNNSPRRGENTKPLLWIFFNDLYAVNCLNSSVTSKQILDFYQEAVKDYPKFFIDDELVVQRQKRKFLEMYRQVK